MLTSQDILTELHRKEPTLTNIESEITELWTLKIYNYIWYTNKLFIDEFFTTLIDNFSRNTFINYQQNNKIISVYKLIDDDILLFISNFYIIHNKKYKWLTNNNFLYFIKNYHCNIDSKQNKNMTTDNNTNEQNYDFVNHPQHYNQWSMEVIDMMQKIYGLENTAIFCEMNAFKYAMRMGFKPTDNIQQDINKRNWYLNKANEIKNLINNNND